MPQRFFAIPKPWLNGPVGNDGKKAGFLLKIRPPSPPSEQSVTYSSRPPDRKTDTTPQHPGCRCPEPPVPASGPVISILLRSQERSSRPGQDRQTLRNPARKLLALSSSSYPEKAQLG
ncbi:hypothetical protein GWI33_000630 [Rhynchophorus ferrugineus]|uniref:Uncharacterized protein n=1 Tax=Rhynchophorus ferrugineus TaxID=354439 RepID=A0A834ILZ1_RHYFE|nr:hypothetical protein GWI33_000630 [Rhynchophorus ferrugineus]